jgi:hypothetical protein
MKKTKKGFSSWAFYDFTGMENHLERMALKGLKLEKISLYFWEYRRIEPQSLHYSVVYMPEASDFNPKPTRGQDTFESYCNEAGWEKVAERAQMQIYCSDLDAPVPIDTDDAEKLHNIHKAMKKNFIPMSLLLTVLMVVQLFLQSRLVKIDPIGYFSSRLNLFNSVMFLGIFIGNISSLIIYLHWYRHAKKRVELGDECPKSYKINQNIYWFVLCGGMLLFLFSDTTFLFSPYSLLFIVAILILVSIQVINIKLRKKFKKANLSKRQIVKRSIVAIIGLTVVYVMILNVIIFWSIDHFDFRRKPVAEVTVFTNYERTWDIYKDALPLTIEEMTGTLEYPYYSYELTHKESPLLSYKLAWQDTFPEPKDKELAKQLVSDAYIGSLTTLEMPYNEAKELNYRIIETPYKWLYRQALNDLFTPPGYDEILYSGNAYRYFEEIDMPLWQAEHVYHQYTQDEADDEYIICWEGRIINIDFNWTPSQEELERAYQSLIK